MQQSFFRRPTTRLEFAGLVLIGVGWAALVLRALGPDVLPSIAAQGWPVFIIIPGVVLLALSLAAVPPRGVGLATGGAAVTTVGSLLLYQSQTGHWESWAYAWALIPAAGGIAMATYGAITRTRPLVTSGTWMAGIAFGLFVAGAWFFEGLFAGEPRPLDLVNAWPIGVMVLGVLLILAAILRRSSGAAPPDHTTSGPDPV